MLWARVLLLRVFSHVAQMGFDAVDARKNSSSSKKESKSKKESNRESSYGVAKKESHHKSRYATHHFAHVPFGPQYCDFASTFSFG